MAYLSKKVRKILDEAGLEDCKIVVSNSLDEYTITSILNQGGKIDSFGVGERLITAKSDPVFGAVYKISAVEENGSFVPRIKVSETVEKITNPGFKKVVRFYDRKTDKALADVIMLREERVDETKPYHIFDPGFVWKKKWIRDFYTRELAVPIFEKGRLVYPIKTTQEIRKECQAQLDTLWPEILRFENPHRYYVDLSESLWKMKQALIDGHSDMT